jgi:hypothetical protein
MERQYEGRPGTLQPAGDAVTDDTSTERIEYRPLDPRVRTMWWSIGAVVLLVALIAAGAAGLPLPADRQLLPLAVVAAIGVPLTVLLPLLRYRRWRFALREEDLWIRHGVIWRTTSVIPYARLQFVDTTQGPIDRLFGLAQLVVHTAAPGTSGRLPGLAAEQAEVLREKLARVRAAARDV